MNREAVGFFFSGPRGGGDLESGGDDGAGGLEGGGGDIARRAAGTEGPLIGTVVCFVFTGVVVGGFDGDDLGTTTTLRTTTGGLVDVDAELEDGGGGLALTEFGTIRCLWKLGRVDWVKTEFRNRADSVFVR